LPAHLWKSFEGFSPPSGINNAIQIWSIEIREKKKDFLFISICFVIYMRHLDLLLYIFSWQHNLNHYAHIIPVFNNITFFSIY
jgi:hypothetical protein